MQRKLSARIRAALMLGVCVLLITLAAQAANKKKDMQKQAQAAEKAGDPAAAQSAYCALAEEDKKNDSARAKCAEYTQRNEDTRKKDADRIAAGEKALAQNHLDEAEQDFKAVVGTYRDTASHYLNVVIPQARLKLKAEQDKAAADAKNNDLLQQGTAAYQRNEFDKAKPLLAAVTGDNAAKAQKLLLKMDDYTKASNEGLRLDNAGSYKEAIERYSRALKIKGDGPGGLKQKIAIATGKLGQVNQATDQPLIDGIAEFYNGNYQQADEKLSAFSGSGAKKALALFYLGASELTRYFLAGADDKSKDLYNQAIEHFHAARQAAAGFKPPQPYVSPRILAVFNQSGS